MRKIVISSNTSWSIYNFRLNLAKTLKEKGYEVILVAPYDKYAEKLKKEFEYYDIYMNNKGTNPIEDIKTTIDFYKLYKRIKPDIVLNFTIKPNIYGTLACSQLNVKTINNIAGLGTLFVNESFTTKIVKFLYKISQKRANKIFFQNKEDYELFVREKLVDKEKCDILPGSGVDVDKFRPNKKSSKNNKFKFLFVARMIKEKGVFEYIKAAEIITSKYKNVEFLMLGALNVSNPSAISKNEIEVFEKKGIIKYLGVTDNIKKVLEEVDCIVLPSYYREGTPRVLLEAAAMEKPIITTDNVGCRDVVDDGVNGFLCKPKDYKDLAEKMEKMINLNETKRKIMGQKGREKIIKEFNEEIVIEKYLEAIKEVITPSHQPLPK